LDQNNYVGRSQTGCWNVKILYCSLFI